MSFFMAGCTHGHWEVGKIISLQKVGYKIQSKGNLQAKMKGLVECVTVDIDTAAFTVVL